MDAMSYIAVRPLTPQPIYWKGLLFLLLVVVFYE